jgi:hypothetical protein
MSAKHVLTILSVVFLSLAARRILRDGGTVAPAVRAWLIVGGMFAVVSVWLWLTG